MSNQSQSQESQATAPAHKLPETKFEAHLAMSRVAKYLESMEYNRRKASQICQSISDLLLAEFILECNLSDLGYSGCQV